jgi:hypothetical protein
MPGLVVRVMGEKARCVNILSPPRQAPISDRRADLRTTPTR